jgi:MFS family permease
LQAPPPPPPITAPPPPPPPPQQPSAEARSEPWRLGPDFTRLWGAAAVSALGDGVRETALPLLAAISTRNPIAVSGILFASKLPWLLATLPAGAIADRVDRRRLVVYVNLFRAGVMTVLFAAVAASVVDLWLLYAVAFLQGVGEVFSDNTAFAMLPSLVPRVGLEKANGRLEAAVVVGTNFAGPALGGVLFAAAVSTPFAVDAGTFAVAAALFFSIAFRPERATAKPVTKLRTDIKEGLVWLRGHVLLRNLSVIAALTNFVLHATFGIFVLYALEILHVNEIGFGLLLSVEAAGALSGSLLASAVRRRMGTAPAILLALLMAGVGNLVIGVTSSVILVGAMAVIVSFSGGLWSVVTNSLRQSIAPDRLMARVQSAHRLLSWGAIPVGTLFGGALAQAFGLRAPFLFAAGALLIFALAGYSLVRGASEAR